MGKPGGFKKQPTVWPTAPFILIKFAQALCSLLVMGIMGFFAYHLHKDKYAIPWQFASLFALSSVSLIVVFGMGIAFCCRGLNALAAMIVEAIISLFWAFGAGAIGKGMGGNITRSCGDWQATEGIVVCHLFKVIFAFCILGWFFFVCSVILASSVRRRAGAHKYQPANPASLQQTTAYAPQSGLGQTSVPYGQGGHYKAQDGAATYS